MAPFVCGKPHQAKRTDYGKERIAESPWGHNEQIILPYHAPSFS
jgi:hypothetical protein